MIRIQVTKQQQQTSRHEACQQSPSSSQSAEKLSTCVFLCVCFVNIAMYVLVYVQSHMSSELCRYLNACVFLFSMKYTFRVFIFVLISDLFSAVVFLSPVVYYLICSYIVRVYTSPDLCLSILICLFAFCLNKHSLHLHHLSSHFPD